MLPIKTGDLCICLFTIANVGCCSCLVTNGKTVSFEWTSWAHVKWSTSCPLSYRLHILKNRSSMSYVYCLVLNRGEMNRALHTFFLIFSKLQGWKFSNKRMQTTLTEIATHFSFSKLNGRKGKAITNTSEIAWWNYELSKSYQNPFL